MGFPKTLQEFQVASPDEGACWELLRRVRGPELEGRRKRLELPAIDQEML